MRNLVILLHRYLGIGLALVFVVWFASGFAIIYTGGMPTLSQNERLSRLPDLDLESVAISPLRAQQLARASSIPKLTTIMERPAYQFASRDGRVVFADDGTVLSNAMISSRRIVAAFTGATDSDIERVGRIEEVDQWTIALRAELPLEKFRVNDGKGTEVYVSPKWGQVLLRTNSTDRFLAWIGAIPHWLYFVDLRKNAALWTDVVVWLASLGTILALLGIVLIFTQLRKVKPFSISRAIPYKGIMRWHYLTGLCFGVVTLTWVFSGLLSMEPYAWNRSGGLAIDRSIFQGGELDLSQFDLLTQENIEEGIVQAVNGSAIKEIELKRSQGDYFFNAVLQDESSSWGFSNKLIETNNLQIKQDLFATQYIVDQLSADQAYEILSAITLQNYDSYYYSRESNQVPSAPLPVLRVQFDDPINTAIYVDLNSSEMVYQSHRLRRIERWLYNGLHSLDFRFWYDSRPIWDIAVIFLLAGGLLLVVIGSYIGIRRLYINVRELAS
ncbi:MAG: hypothetical protein GKR91_18815 [Pseudomonadales bacterium]|nr:hypothetical protein [Pseudomonadales bacterium]